jgi:hypothetical protein
MAVNAAAPAATVTTPPAAETPVAAAPETPVAVAAPAPTPAPASADPNVIPVPKSMYDEFMGYKATVAKLETERLAAESKAKEEVLKAQIKDGQIQEVLNGLKKQTEETAAAEAARRAVIEKRAEKYALDSQLSAALASQNLVTNGAAQLRALWEKEFVVEAAGDTYAVRTPQLQSVNDFVATKLATPEYSHFVRATTQGGVGVNPAASQSVPTPAAHSAPQPEPQTFGDAIVQLSQQQKAMASVNPQGASSRGSDGRALEMPSFGLRRVN